MKCYVASMCTNNRTGWSFRISLGYEWFSLLAMCLWS